MRTRRVLAPTRRQAMSLSTISQVGVRGKGIMVSMEPTMTISPEKGRYDFGVVSLATRKSMQGNKRRDTKPEIKVRQMLRAMGFTGYRCDWKKAPGRPDVAFVGRKKAIFVMGCFWHRCPVCNLSVPKKNVEYWEEKFARNRERDERNLAALAEQGWDVLVLWEHQLKKKELPATHQLLYEFVRREGDPPYGEAFPAEDGGRGAVAKASSAARPASTVA